MRLRKVNDEVYIADEPIVRIGPAEIAFVKTQACANARRRVRICAHRANDDALHEMVIAISAASYIHPHKHLAKSESFHVMEGIVDVVVFDDGGEIVDVVELGDPSTGRSVYYRLSDPRFHTLLIRTDLLVVHEVTNGPFDRNRTLLAPFAPGENEPEAAASYIRRVMERVALRAGTAASAAGERP